MRTDVLQLILQTQTTDDLGDPVIQETRREVFCELRSIGAKEFYQAQAVGFQPELKFVLADFYDYEGEPLVEYEGQRYRVLRTYRTGKALELTVYRGVNPA
jgi:hypothetical protein